MYCCYVGTHASCSMSDVSIVPAPGQLPLLSPPADGGRRVSVHLAEEVHRVVCQHHLAHRLLGEHGPLCRQTDTQSRDRGFKLACGATSCTCQQITVRVYSNADFVWTNEGQLGQEIQTKLLM